MQVVRSLTNTWIFVIQQSTTEKVIAFTMPSHLNSVVLFDPCFHLSLKLRILF